MRVSSIIVVSSSDFGKKCTYISCSQLRISVNMNVCICLAFSCGFWELSLFSVADIGKYLPYSSMLRTIAGPMSSSSGDDDTHHDGVNCSQVGQRLKVILNNTEVNFNIALSLFLSLSLSQTHTHLHIYIDALII